MLEDELGGINRRSVSNETTVKKVITDQVRIDKYVVKLHWDLGHVLETVSKDTFCIHENSIGYLNIVK